MSKNFYPNRSYVSGITPPKLLNRKTLSILFMLIAFSPFMAKAQVKKQVMTTVTQNNGTGGVSFNIKAKNSIKITDFLVTINSGSNNWEVWYSTDSVNGAPKISTTTGWTQLETGSVTGNGSTPVSLGMTKTLVMQAGKTYGFYIGQNNMRYHTYTTSDPAVFSDLNVQLNTGPGVGYGGSISPTIATRQLCGGVEYELLNRSKNDIGITDLIEPTTFCSGTQKIKVKVNNFGINQIDSFRIGWEINDTLRKPFVFKSKLDTFGGKGNSSDTITIGSLSFPSGGVSYDLKVWTYSPNGGKDTINKNDTLIVTLRPSLSGSYTIDPSGTAKNNFKTFADLFKTFESAGVCGPVSVKVANGTYKEQVVVPEIMGTSSKNTITIDGGDSSKTILTSSGGVTLQLLGADYITFKNMQIENTSSSSGYAVLLTKQADYNVFTNCRIECPTASTSLVIPFMITGGTYSSYGDNGNYNTLKNSYVAGGYAGICMNGSGSTDWCEGNTIENCTVRDVYYYGIRTYYQDGETIKNNDVLMTASTGSYGLYSYYGTNSIIDGNNIQAGYYGLRVYYSNYYNQVGSKTLVINNMVSNSYNYSNFYGLYIYNGYNTKVYHNSILDNGPGTGGYSAYFYQSSAQNNDFVNNIIETLTANKRSFYFYPNFNAFDYNNIYNPNGVEGYYNGTLYTDFSSVMAAWNANGYMDHGISQDPGFVSTTFGSADLHVDQTQPSPYGLDMGVKTDFDGDPRCPFAPTLGADENMYGKTNTKVQFYLPKVIYEGSPTIVTNSAKLGEPKSHKWYINGKEVSDSVTLYTTSFKGPKDELKLVTQSCSGKDSFVQTVTVTQPSQKPVPAFISSKNIITQGQSVKFTDLSNNGPNKWKWEITPDVAYVDNVISNRYKYTYGSDTTPSNTVRFDVAGRYKVCLTVGNGKGNAPQKCVVDYITVLPAIIMGDVTSAQDTAGYIYDDGGPFGEYSNNFNKGLLIAPCASEVYLVINKFDVECGSDFLRIYDGSDNSGKQLNTCKPTGYTGGPRSKSCSNYCPPNPYDTLVATSGKMYIEFVSNSNTTLDGFEAQWWSTPKVGTKPPVASFEIPDSICTGHALEVTNNSKGESVQYLWDFDEDPSTVESNDKDPFWVYFFPTKVKVTLIAYNCGGSDTITKEVVVSDPSTPKAILSADNTNPTTTDIVTLSTGVNQCVDILNWKVYKTYDKSVEPTYVNSTSSKSMHPQLTFKDTGCYTVELYVENTNGKDSSVNKCFINVKNSYCFPSVANMISDIGISYVEIGDISNSSQQGKVEYSNYTPTISTHLEIGQTYELTVSRNTNANAITRTVWIDLNGDGQFSASEKIAESVNSKTRVWTTQVTIPITNTKLGASVMRVAVNAGSEENAVCGQNLFGEYEDYRVYITTDRTAPEITLKGEDTMIVEQGRSFTDPGATAEDNLDGNITIKIVKDAYDINDPSSPFSALNPGTYRFTYNVKDAAGNKAKTAERIVIIIADTTAPDLQVEMPDTVQLGVNTPIILPQVIQALDLVDGDLYADVVINQAVDNTILGYYKVTYSVTDANNNTAIQTRWVWVADTTLPIINLIGGPTIYHEVNTPYSDAGVTVKDNYYTNAELMANLVVDSNIDVTKLGTYTYIYTLTDPSGNGPVSVTRTIYVVDRTAPILSLNGDKNIIVDVNTQYVDAGAMVTDNLDQNISVTLSGSFYDAFPDGFADKLGVYTIVYTAKDASGNITSITRQVEVKDRKAPEIALVGDLSANVCRWKEYTDLGYTLNDNYDDSAAIIVEKEGSFLKNQTLREGIYALRYKATDKSGNVSYSEYRTILVKSPETCNETAINELANLENNIKIYPNPSNGKFIISLNELNAKSLKLHITNLLGQDVNGAAIQIMNTKQITLDMNGQATGIYLITITDGKASVTKRLILN